MHDTSYHAPSVSVRHCKKVTTVGDYLIRDVKRRPIASVRRSSVQQLLDFRWASEDNHRLVGELEREDGSIFGGPFGHL